MTEPFATCPANLTQGSGVNEVDWQRDPTVAARRDDDVEDRYHLLAIDAADDDCFPVYRQHPGTTPAVATGTLFLRLHEGHTIAAFGPTLAALGLGVAASLDWAPNAAWVKALNGSRCHALNQLSDLARLERVAHVEAQLALTLSFR